MSIPFVIDMNLSPEWAGFLTAAGWPSIHWTSLGDIRAGDAEIMAWALANGHAVFTHDFDFGTALALTGAKGPSVFQIRGKQVLPEQVGNLVLNALNQCEADLLRGALVGVETNRLRVRVLPLTS